MFKPLVNSSLKSFIYLLKVISAILFIILLASCQEKQRTNFSVIGQLTNTTDSKLIAVRVISNDSLIIDTIQINKDGKFKYEGLIDSPSLIYIIDKQESEPITFYLDKEYNIKIRGDIQKTDLIEIKGGQVNDDLQSFREDNQNLFTEKYRILHRNNTIEIAQLKNIKLQLAQKALEYTKQNSSQIASVILLTQFALEYTSLQTLSKSVNSLKDVTTDFFLTKYLQDYCRRIANSDIGAIAPPLELENTKGKKINPLSQFKDKHILLMFDLKESYMKNTDYFEALNEAHKKIGKKVQFVSIIIDGNKPSDTKSIFSPRYPNWTVLLDNKKWGSTEVKKYNIKTVPYMILISPEGKIEEREISLDSLLVKFTKK